jgi:hypothetical protein
MYFQPGDRVRIRECISEPAFGWGTLSSSDHEIGVVRSVSLTAHEIQPPHLAQVNVNFPGHSDFKLCAYELELLQRPAALRGAELLGGYVYLRRRSGNDKPRFDWGTMRPHMCESHPGRVTEVRWRSMFDRDSPERHSAVCTVEDLSFRVQFAAHADFLAAAEDLVPCPEAVAAMGSSCVHFALTTKKPAVGQLVRIKPSVLASPEGPHFGLGSIKATDVGLVSAVSGVGGSATLKVDFPRSTAWTGRRNELEVVEFRHIPTHIPEPGSWLEVHGAIATPTYAWGAARPGKVGRLTRVEPFETSAYPSDKSHAREIMLLLSDVIMDFPGGPESWRGVMYEMEKASPPESS